ncbi:MAG: virginiamycin B lyase family protein [Nitrospirales bacterium]
MPVPHTSKVAGLGVWGPVTFAVVLWSCSGQGSEPSPTSTYSQTAITEWSVPWEGTRPRDPFVDQRGKVWFVGQQGGYLAVLDPGTGTFERFDLEPGAGPHNLIVDGQGAVWYTGNRSAHIGKRDPDTGQIRTYTMPDPSVRDPHTLICDQSGHIWFTAQQGNAVGRLTMETGEIRLIPVPTPRARPYGLVIDPRQRPWFTEFGANKLGTVDPATLTLQEVSLPRAEARPRRLAATSDGAIWYVDYAEGYLGRLDPDTKTVKEWPVPGGSNAHPYAMAADDRDRLWFVETGLHPNRLVGFDPQAGRFFNLTEIPSGGGTVRHMVFHPPTGTIWFGTDANTIGRAKVP